MKNNSCLKALLFFLIIITASNVLIACDPPVITNYSNRGLHEIKVNWINLNANDAWEIELVRSGESFSGIPNSPLIFSWNYLFEGLDAGTEYCFRIRGICDDEPGPWNVPYCFITNLSDQEENCDLDFQLEDPTLNQAYADKEFYYSSELFQDAILGQDVFIQGVSLIIEHNWPSDLQIFLSSPAGKTMVLSNKQGFNSNHYGVPTDENCDSVAFFSDEACDLISDKTRLVGEFQAEERFSELYDGSSLNGHWKLTIRDHNPGHRGRLKNFNITLVESTCRLPEVIYIEANGPESCVINWRDESHNCDSIMLQFGPAGFQHGQGSTLKFNGDMGSFLLEGLEANGVYDFYFRSQCDSEYSVISCPYSFQTDCNEISLRSSFDEQALCYLDCQESCLISEQWFNAAYPYNQWLVNTGKTSTSDTGPLGDFGGFGNYLYVESSENNCAFNSEAILQTDCFEIRSNQNACDFSFYYQMYGADIGSLRFQISVDDGETWVSLFEKTGDQGSQWERAFIDLSLYDGLAGRFRFISTFSEESDGERGDIALDELIFYGSEPVIEAQYLYFEDNDYDHYGAATEPMFFCSNAILDGFSRNNLDCDDNDPGVNPDMPEIPCNSIDENCNGIQDDLDFENPLGIQILEVKDESCKGSTDGILRVEATGGMAPYIYEWSNGVQDSLLNGLGAGIYYCIIRDTLGCVLQSETMEITSGAPLTFILEDQSIVSCKGVADGVIKIDHEGGLGPFEYLWSNGATTKHIDELFPGSYQVTITDVQGCELISPEIELLAATKFTVGIGNSAPKCYGQTNGSIQIIGIQDGIPPYKYLWNTGDTTELISNLAKGYYALTVTDASFCQETIDSIFLDEAHSLEMNLIAKDNVSCYGDSDGTIEINAIGGVAPYTFNWTKNGQLFATGDDLYNLYSGSYELTLRDNNACIYKSEPILIEEPERISIEVDSIFHSNCIASRDGSIFVSAKGGTGEYQYFWNTFNDGNAYLKNLNPGLYNVVVIDKYGCKSFENGLEVEYLDIALESSIEVLSELSCYGDSSASVNIIVEEAALPVDFNWNAGIKRVKDMLADTLYNLEAGWFQTTVTDAEGCVGVSEFIEIKSPDALWFQVVNVDELLCANDFSGKIELYIGGGIPPYEIEWNNQKTTELIKDLDGGFYTALVRDDKDCLLNIDSIFVFEPDPISVTVHSFPSSIGQNNGMATVIPEGGTTPYQYQWDEIADFQTGPTASALKAGDYWVTVTDYNLCEKEVYVFIDSLSVGVSDQLENDVRIFPNPVSNFLYVSSSNNVSKAMIQDIYGRSFPFLEQGILNPELSVFDLSDIPIGLYLLILEIEGIQVVRQLVIMR